jgi:hypothetical protein
MHAREVHLELVVPSLLILVVGISGIRVSPTLFVWIGGITRGFIHLFFTLTVLCLPCTGTLFILGLPKEIHRMHS